MKHDGKTRYTPWYLLNNKIILNQRLCERYCYVLQSMFMGVCKYYEKKCLAIVEIFYNYYTYTFKCLSSYNYNT